MTWRRFLMLLAGFSANSRLALDMQNSKNVISDPETAKRAFAQWAK